MEPATANTVATPKEEVMQEKETITPKIYALWDSLTAWYQLPLEDSYPEQLENILKEKGYNYELINAWKSGDTSAWLLSRIQWLTEDAQEGDMAILVIWANDGLQSLPLDDLQENIEETIRFLKSIWISVILWWMQLPTNLDPSYRERFADMYPNIGQTHNLQVVPFFLEDVAAIPSLNLSDGIHPNKAWYAIIANNLYSFLVENNIITK